MGNIVTTVVGNTSITITENMIYISANEVRIEVE